MATTSVKPVIPVEIRSGTNDHIIKEASEPNVSDRINRITAKYEADAKVLVGGIPRYMSPTIVMKNKEVRKGKYELGDFVNHQQQFRQSSPSGVTGGKKPIGVWKNTSTYAELPVQKPRGRGSVTKRSPRNSEAFFDKLY